MSLLAVSTFRDIGIYCSKFTPLPFMYRMWFLLFCPVLLGPGPFFGTFLLTRPEHEQNTVLNFTEKCSQLGNCKSYACLVAKLN